MSQLANTRPDHIADCSDAQLQAIRAELHRIALNHGWQDLMCQLHALATPVSHDHLVAALELINSRIITRQAGLTTTQHPELQEKHFSDIWAPATLVRNLWEQARGEFNASSKDQHAPAATHAAASPKGRLASIPLPPAPRQLPPAEFCQHVILHKNQPHTAPVDSTTQSPALQQHPFFQFALDLAELGIHPLDLSPALQASILPQHSHWISPPLLARQPDSLSFSHASAQAYTVYHAFRKTVPPLGSKYLTSWAHLMNGAPLGQEIEHGIMLRLLDIFSNS